MMPPNVSIVEFELLTWLMIALAAKVSPTPSPKTTRRVPQGEPETDGQRPLALGHELAGGVVDGRDVVSVERVAETQGVRRDSDPDPEELRVLGQDCDDEDAPADDVEPDDEAEHAADPAPLPGGQRATDAAQTRRRGGHALPPHVPGTSEACSAYQNATSTQQRPGANCTVQAMAATRAILNK